MSVFCVTQIFQIAYLSHEEMLGFLSVLSACLYKSSLFKSLSFFLTVLNYFV